MSSRNQRKLQQSKQRYREKIEVEGTLLFEKALIALQRGYKAPMRPRLTHFWLAQQLDCTNVVSFRLLQRIARLRLFCIQFPTGPIYWDNDKLTVGEILKLMGRRL